MKKLILLFLIPAIQLQAQTDTLKNETRYSFVIQDSPSQLFTMRQFNQSYLSAYHMFSRELYRLSTREQVADLIQVGLQTLFLMPLTHEEGHRSILTGKNIGSVSQPFFNKYGAAYVKGVSNSTLQNLRDTDFPTFIRLHTGGLESDYMLTKRMEAIGSFGLDKFKYYKYEYWIRKLAIMQYYLTGLIKFEVDLKEETNELERDVVGYDTYGAARHLFRPGMDFYRYTRYEHLTGEERRFVHRMGYRSLLNLLNPLIIGKENFKLRNGWYLNAGMGYTLAPFGDFIDENIWLKFSNVNLSFYARQFQNREHWFPGFGLGVTSLKLSDRIFADINGHFWQQPENFSFHTSNSFTGGAGELDLSYFFFSNKNKRFGGFSVDLGMTYKTNGFLPEELFMNEHFGLKLGTTIILND